MQNATFTRYQLELKYVIQSRLLFSQSLTHKKVKLKMSLQSSIYRMLWQWGYEGQAEFILEKRAMLQIKKKKPTRGNKYNVR